MWKARLLQYLGSYEDFVLQIACFFSLCCNLVWQSIFIMNHYWLFCHRYYQKNNFSLLSIQLVFVCDVGPQWLSLYIVISFVFVLHLPCRVCVSQGHVTVTWLSHDIILPPVLFRCMGTRPLKRVRLVYSQIVWDSHVQI